MYEFNDNGLDTIRSALSGSTSKMGELSKALQDGEWDADPTTPSAPRAAPPVVTRASAYKAEIKEAEGMGHRIEAKERDIKELKLAIRAKGEELSEMQVGVPMNLVRKYLYRQNNREVVEGCVCERDCNSFVTLDDFCRGQRISYCAIHWR